MGNSNLRIEALQKFLEENPSDSFSLYALALEYAGAGKKTEAIALLEKIIATDPEYLACYYQLGKLYESAGNENLAVTTYQKGIAIAESQKNIKTLNELRTAIEMTE